MGEVYQAKDTRLKREVAMKVLPDAFASDPDRLARFQREAESRHAESPQHRVGLRFEQSDGTRAIVLELIEGETLADRIRTRRDSGGGSDGDRAADCRSARSGA